MVFSHHGGAGETFVFIKTGIFSRKIHLINRFSEYLIILNFSFWWIWSLKKLKCLFDFEKAQDKIRRQTKHSNQPLHVFTIQPASLSNMMVPTSSGRSPKSYFQISIQDGGGGNFHILNLFFADWVWGYKRVSQFECVLYEYYPSSILDGDQMCQAVENHQALSRKSTTQRKRKFKRWEWKGEC